MRLVEAEPDGLDLPDLNASMYFYQTNSLGSCSALQIEDGARNICRMMARCWSH